MSDKDITVVKALIMLDEKLEQEKLRLREEACQIAEKQRQIKKLISASDREAVKESDAVIDAWTIKKPEELNKSPELFQLIEDMSDRPGFEDHARRLLATDSK